jgi:hypothetical protein
MYALRLARLCCFRNEILGELMGVYGVLMRLLGEFVSGQMISFTVGSGSSGVGVGSEVVKFCGSIVRTLWHVFS